MQALASGCKEVVLFTISQVILGLLLLLLSPQNVSKAFYRVFGVILGRQKETIKASNHLGNCKAYYPLSTKGKSLHAVPHNKVRNFSCMPLYIVEQEDRTDWKTPPHQ